MVVEFYYYYLVIHTNIYYDDIKIEKSESSPNFIIYYYLI